jgi:hypothetical protein
MNKGIKNGNIVNLELFGWPKFAFFSLKYSKGKAAVI